MPCTFGGVVVSTVPTRSPVAGFKDSSAGFAVGLAFERFVEDLVVLLTLGLDFRLVRVLRELLASIACFLSSLALVPAILRTRYPRAAASRRGRCPNFPRTI